MLGKSTRRPVIGKIIKPDNSGHRNLYSDEIISSPKSPLDFKMRSPRGMKNCDMGGVGLGIVAALEKSGGGGGVEIPMKLILGSLNLNMNLNKSSVPIPIGSSSATRNCREEKVVEEDEEESESYTYVTCHNGPNKKSVTRVYCDHGGIVENELFENHQNHKSKNLGVFYESPPRFTESKLLFPTSDFLSSCYLCRKNLHGKDIYMYRGEKAFCSTECRQNQIVKDERKEKCRREASIYGDQYASISPYSNGGQQQQLHFSPGITAS